MMVQWVKLSIVADGYIAKKRETNTLKYDKTLLTSDVSMSKSGRQVRIYPSSTQHFGTVTRCHVTTEWGISIVIRDHIMEYFHNKEYRHFRQNDI